jgi:hypothetical protein
MQTEWGRSELQEVMDRARMWLLKRTCSLRLLQEIVRIGSGTEVTRDSRGNKRKVSDEALFTLTGNESVICFH